ncbi:MAG: oxygenase MpaB family protein [Leadbetterella sp.]
MTNNQVQNRRLQGDPEADRCIESVLLLNYPIPDIISYLIFDENKSQMNTELFETFICKEQKAVSLDKKNLTRACNFYSKHKSVYGLMLACYSLPYCYLAENGARVLLHSTRMVDDTKKRLKETGEFIQCVLDYDSWISGKAQKKILKVRLLHALWRNHLQKSKSWNMNWGLPINQEDMIGTNLSFSYIILKGLKKMGVHIDVIDERAFMKHWYTIGKLMGICDGNSIDTYPKALHMDKHIADKEFRASETGKTLTKSLFEAIGSLTNNVMVLSYLKSQSRILLGTEHANWLGIEETQVPTVFIKSMRFTSSIISSIYD